MNIFGQISSRFQAWFIQVTATALKLANGLALRIYDSLGTSYSSLGQSATELTLESVVTGADGAIRFLPKGAGAVEIRSGKTLKIFNAGNTENSTISRDDNVLRINGDTGIIYLALRAGVDDELEIYNNTIYVMPGTDFNFQGNNGSAINYSYTTEEVTIPAGSGAAGVLTTAQMLPTASIIKAVLIRTTQAPGGGATTATFAGETDTTEIMSNVGISALGTVANNVTDHTPATDHTAPWYVGAGSQRIRVTTNANVTGASLKIRITVFYEQITNLTS